MGMHNIQVYFTIALDHKDKKKNNNNAVYLYSKWYSNIFLAKHGCISVAAIVCAFDLDFQLFFFLPLCIYFLHISAAEGEGWSQGHINKQTRGIFFFFFLFYNYFQELLSFGMD